MNSTVPDIFRHPDQFFLVQFAVSSDGDAKALGASVFSIGSSPKYPDYPFAGPRGSRFGIRRRNTATHWAIVHVDPKTDTPSIVLHGTLESVVRKKRIIPFGHGTSYYLILRGSAMYFTLFVSTHDTIPSTTNHNTTSKDSAA